MLTIQRYSNVEYVTLNNFIICNTINFVVVALNYVHVV